MSINLSKEDFFVFKEKYYFNVPYERKNEAKRKGMKWDGDNKKWYIDERCRLDELSKSFEICDIKSIGSDIVEKQKETKIDKDYEKESNEKDDDIKTLTRIIRRLETKVINLEKQIELKDEQIKEKNRIEKILLKGDNDKINKLIIDKCRENGITL